MRTTILFGGQAGQGSNVLTHILSRALIAEGYYVFYSRDYQSLIRGGHNFNLLTFSEKPVHSNESKYDLIIALDEKTVKLHKDNLKKHGETITGKGPNMYFAGIVFKTLGLSFDSLRRELEHLKHRFKENVHEASEGHKFASVKMTLIKTKNKDKITLANGSMGISDGAIQSGLDIYYAYPMTPATGVLTELAQKAKEKNLVVMELENEIAVGCAGVGSSITGAKTMVGTSGGGFDLMSEGLSMAGIAEAPLVYYLAQRVGPASGVPTYQAQGDMHMARYSGHGEFPRVVLAPGDPTEAFEITTQAFYFSQEFKIPSIILSDKHLAESFYSTNLIPTITKSKKSTEFGRYNSYEKDYEGSATEDKDIIYENITERLSKIDKIKSRTKKFPRYKTYGNRKSKNCIMFWGSTKGAVLDAILGKDIFAIQILYIEPFPEEVANLMKDKNLILVENNATGQLGELIKEKIGIKIKNENKILKFDGRPFLQDELSNLLKELME